MTNRHLFTYSAAAMIPKGMPTITATITPTLVASATFRGWYSPSLLASINFGPIGSYPYTASLSINPAAVVLSGVTRLVFRTSSEYQVGPLPGSCPTGPQGIGNRFTAPLLEVTYAVDSPKIYLPVIVKNFGG